MSPISFLQNPILWIELMSRLGAHWSAAPDFAYALCARKFQEKSENDKASFNLDLSSVVTLLTGAEPIREETKLLFEKVFNIVQFRF